MSLCKHHESLNTNPWPSAEQSITKDNQGH
jgi:hypothetical protein